MTLRLKKRGEKALERALDADVEPTVTKKWKKGVQDTIEESEEPPLSAGLSRSSASPPLQFHRRETAEIDDDDDI